MHARRKPTAFYSVSLLLDFCCEFIDFSLSYRPNTIFIEDLRNPLLKGLGCFCMFKRGHDDQVFLTYVIVNMTAQQVSFNS